MAPDTRRFILWSAFLFLPIIGWAVGAHHLGLFHAPGSLIRNTFALVPSTWSYEPLVYGLVGGFVAAALIFLLMLLPERKTDGFAGAKYRKFVRGTRVATAEKLRSLTQQNTPQIDVAGIPMPTEAETLHLLINGATGSGKSVMLRQLTYTARRRGDRMFVVDPNGDLLSRFARPGDVILNPYDARTQGWSFYNEIRADYDWHRFAFSIVPLGKDANAEEWNTYGRLLLREAAKKLHIMGQPSIHELFRWCTIAPPEELKLFLEGTLAESLFAGSSEASRALSSARFVLSSKLAEHTSMPAGDFSIRDWLEDPNAGSLFVTWREDMAKAMKPLVSAWTDVFCTSILSLPESRSRRWWLNIDELASLEKLASLQDALTKGRKHGLRVCACLQATSQLNDIYGGDQAQTLRASFRSLVVLGGAKTDPQTAEDMSKALGEHEVERIDYSQTRAVRSDSTGERIVRTRERVVMPAEVAALPHLTGYVAFAGELPIARVVLTPTDFRQHTAPFVEPTTFGANP